MENNHITDLINKLLLLTEYLNLDQILMTYLGCYLQHRMKGKF